MHYAARYAQLTHLHDPVQPLLQLWHPQHVQSPQLGQVPANGLAEACAFGGLEMAAANRASKHPFLTILSHDVIAFTSSPFKRST